MTATTFIQDQLVNAIKLLKKLLKSKEVLNYPLRSFVWWVIQCLHNMDIQSLCKVDAYRDTFEFARPFLRAANDDCWRITA
jgi:hypothetical protein